MMDIQTLTLLLGGFLFVGMGLAIIVSRRKGFKQIPLTTQKEVSSVESTAATSKTESSGSGDGPKIEVIRKVPLEKLSLPEGFPREIVFYFGSQTGTAEKFCTALEQEAHSIFSNQLNGSGIQRQAKVLDLEDFKGDTFGETFSDQLVVFCISTHYEGDPCDNYKKAYRWLRDPRKDKSSSTLFKNVHYIVFGLGDSSYEQFNIMGKFFNETLEELGARRVFRYGEGNAEGNKTEDEFNAWKVSLWEELADYYTSNPIQPSTKLVEQQSLPGEENKVEEPKQIQKPGKAYPLVLETIEPPGDMIQAKEFDQPLEMVSKQHLQAKELRVKVVRELRQKPVEGTEQTLELTYDLAETAGTYKTATNLAFFPENTNEDVEWIAKEVLKMDPDQWFVFKHNTNSGSKRSTPAKHPFPTPIIVGDAIRKYVDLRGQLRKKLLQDLAEICLDPTEKQE